MSSDCSIYSKAIGVSSNASSTSNPSIKEPKMRKRVPQYLMICLAFMVMAIIAPSSALATNGHQDHRGACARSTTSISKGVGDLAYNGVAGKFASKMGIKSINGSVTQQLNNQLVVAKIAKAVKTNNSGCDGHGHTFGAGKRTLYKGEKVAVKRPANVAKSDVCTNSHSGCKPLPFSVTFVLPASCWNGNYAVTIKVVIWVKKGKAPSKGKSKSKTQKQTQNGNAPLGSCAGTIVTLPSGQTICQMQVQSQSNKTDQSGTTSGQGSPVINVNNNVQVENQNQNGNENNTGGNTQTQEQQQIQACALANGQWNTVTHNCDHPTPPPPGCTSNCTPQQPTDHPPVITAYWPPHIYVNDTQKVYFEAIDQDGDPFGAPTITSSNTNSKITGIKEVPYRYDNTACPSGWTCFEGTLWGVQTGSTVFTATVNAGGKSASSTSPAIQVVDSNDGFRPSGFDWYMTTSAQPAV